MTGKRFELNNIVKKGTVSFWDNKKQKVLNASHSLDLLNELDEKWIDEYALRETLQQELQRVEEENKHLRQQINELQFNKTIGQQEYQRRVFYE